MSCAGGDANVVNIKRLSAGLLFVVGGKSRRVQRINNKTPR